MEAATIPLLRPASCRRLELRHQERGAEPSW